MFSFYLRHVSLSYMHFKNVTMNRVNHLALWPCSICYQDDDWHSISPPFSCSISISLCSLNIEKYIYFLLNPMTESQSPLKIKKIYRFTHSLKTSHLSLKLFWYCDELLVLDTPASGRIFSTITLWAPKEWCAFQWDPLSLFYTTQL